MLHPYVAYLWNGVQDLLLGKLYFLSLEKFYVEFFNTGQVGAGISFLIVKNYRVSESNSVSF
jgi:hypothetical protein